MWKLHRNPELCSGLAQGDGTNRENPKRRFSQKTAGFRRFTPFLFWITKETAENGRFFAENRTFSQQTTGNRRLWSITLGPGAIRRTSRLRLLQASIVTNCRKEVRKGIPRASRPWRRKNSKQSRKSQFSKLLLFRPFSSRSDTLSV